jgi:DNA-binding PadR family transcriptional regulator
VALTQAGGLRLHGAVTSIRLFVLGTLARGGPMHGHEIRRLARTERTELWTDVKPGSLYAALHRLAAEGAIAEVRTEQAGNLPERVVYGITEAGRAEYLARRDAALRDAQLRPDPVDLALQNTDDLSGEQLTAAIAARRRALADQLESWRRLRGVAAPYLHGLEDLTFRHALARLEAEITWHDELLAAIPEHVRTRPAGP